MTRMIGAGVMLDEKKWNRLRILAEREGKTMADFLRGLIEEYLKERDRLDAERFLDVLAELRQIRERNAARWGVYEGDLISDVREERMRQMEDVCSQWSYKHCSGAG
jgi:predicted DNA-binding protein